MRQYIRKIFKTNIYINSLLYIFYKFKFKFKQKCGNIESDSGATHLTLPLLESIDYIERVFDDYRRISKVSKFPGRVAELGPGDNDGVALMFLAGGAAEIDLADRFYSRRDDKRSREIYDELAARHPILENIVKCADYTKESHFTGVTRFYGESAAGEFFFQKHKNYDYIISRSVLEHVNEPLQVLTDMYHALNIGGLLMHKVDLRDHGMFTPFSYPLKFLEIPGWIYKLLAYDTGNPNRILLHQYKSHMKKICSDVRFYIGGLHGVPDLEREYLFEDIPEQIKRQAICYIENNRKYFAREFAQVPSEDLMISSFFLVCKKSPSGYA